MPSMEGFWKYIGSLYSSAVFQKDSAWLGLSFCQPAVCLWAVASHCEQVFSHEGVSHYSAPSRIQRSGVGAWGLGNLGHTEDVNRPAHISWGNWWYDLGVQRRELENTGLVRGLPSAVCHPAQAAFPWRASSLTLLCATNVSDCPQCVRDWSIGYVVNIHNTGFAL